MRANEIRGRFTRLFCDNLSFDVIEVDDRDWEAVMPSSRYRFGYGPPALQMVPDAPTLVIPFSAERLDEVTAGLNEAHFDLYLTAVEAYVSAHLMFVGLPPDRATAAVEAHILEHAPETLALMSDVEMRATDAGIGATRS